MHSMEIGIQVGNRIRNSFLHLLSTYIRKIPILRLDAIFQNLVHQIKERLSGCVLRKRSKHTWALSSWHFLSKKLELWPEVQELTSKLCELMNSKILSSEKSAWHPCLDNTSWTFCPITCTKAGDGSKT